MNPKCRFEFTEVPLWVLTLTTAAMCSVAVSKGTGQHIATIPPSQLNEALRFNLIASVFCVMNITVPKLAVAILLRRLLNPSRFVIFGLYFLPVGAIAWDILIVILTFTSCISFLGGQNHQRCVSPEVLEVCSLVAGGKLTSLQFSAASTTDDISICGLRRFCTCRLSCFGPVEAPNAMEKKVML